MKKVIVLVLVLITAALLAVGYNTVYKAPEITASDIQQPVGAPLNADTIFTLVNAERTQKGLKPLKRDARLDATAQERADDMVKRDYFSHFDPVTGAKMIKKQDAGCAQSENIGEVYGFSDNNKQKVTGWMNSKSHRNAILNPDYTLTGVAIAGDKVVQHFCVSK